MLICILCELSRQTLTYYPWSEALPRVVAFGMHRMHNRKTHTYTRRYSTTASNITFTILILHMPNPCMFPRMCAYVCMIRGEACMRRSLCHDDGKRHVRCPPYIWCKKDTDIKDDFPWCHSSQIMFMRATCIRKSGRSKTYEIDIHNDVCQERTI